jgi:hypothetical protein
MLPIPHFSRPLRGFILGTQIAIVFYVCLEIIALCRSKPHALPERSDLQAEKMFVAHVEMSTHEHCHFHQNFLVAQLQKINIFFLLSELQRSLRFWHFSDELADFIPKNARFAHHRGVRML